LNQNIYVKKIVHFVVSYCIKISLLVETCSLYDNMTNTERSPLISEPRLIGI